MARMQSSVGNCWVFYAGPVLLARVVCWRETACHQPRLYGAASIVRNFSRPWRLHDIRRTVATRLAELVVQPHVVEAVLNHVFGHRSGVAGT